MSATPPWERFEGPHLRYLEHQIRVELVQPLERIGRRPRPPGAPPQALVQLGTLVEIAQVLVHAVCVLSVVRVRPKALLGVAGGAARTLCRIEPTHTIRCDKPEGPAVTRYCSGENSSALRRRGFYQILPENGELKQTVLFQ